MNTYRVTLLVEQDDLAKRDLEIVKTVHAADSTEAANNAMILVKMQNPSINAAKIWASVREQIFSSLVINPLTEMCGHV
jgi:hypothetical protein